MLLEGRVAIITGAAHGIGRACAERVAREGAKVVLADIDDTAGEEAAAAITASGGEALFVACHVSKANDVRDLIARACAAFTTLDILVNNAAVVADQPFLELEEAEFDRILRTNLKGAFKGAFLLSQGSRRG